MIKRISLLQRKAGLTIHEFNQHWKEIHAPLARKVPGLRRYVQNHIAGATSRVDISDIDITIDGIAELWWDNAETMKTSVQSIEAQALFADGALFISNIKTYLIDEKIIVGKGK